MAETSQPSTAALHTWIVTFKGVTNLGDVKQALEASLFYRRLAGPKEVTVSLQQVVFTFGAPKDRNDVMKLCTQQFQKYSTYASRTIVNVWQRRDGHHTVPGSFVQLD